MADVIGIEIEHVNFAADYKDRVFAEFLREYQAGPHAQPRCAVQCRDQVQRLPRPRHAPGRRKDCHRPLRAHAPERRKPACSNCSRAWIKSKDQSYFLHRLNQAQLSKAHVPAGRSVQDRGAPHRREVRPAQRQEKSSTGICFIGERPFREFLNRYMSKEQGPIVDDRGRNLGQHVGLRFYTLGQRSGLGIGGDKEKGAAVSPASMPPGFWRRKDVPRKPHPGAWYRGTIAPWLLSHRAGCRPGLLGWRATPQPLGSLWLAKRATASPMSARE